MAQVANFAKVTVLNPYNSAATSIVLAGGNGAKLPQTTPFNVVWWNFTDFADPSDDPNVEIVRVTNIATDTLTVTRAQESTVASNKNTAGKTYKMIAGFTAKGPETIGAGLGAAPPAYVVDVRGASITGQVHITDHDADDGGYIQEFHGAAGSFQFAHGAFFNGTNWIAKETTATILQIGNSGVSLIIYHDTGLTVGNTYTPTQVARYDASGNGMFASTNAPNVAVDTPGAIATRFASVTLVNGLNSNIAIGASGNIRATGPTLGYSLGGFQNGFDGRKLYFYNNIAQTVTIVNGDASSTAANRIQTNTGGNVTLNAGAVSWAEFTYDSTLSLWILNGHN